MAGTFFLSPAEEVSPAVGRPSPQPAPRASLRRRPSRARAPARSGAGSHRRPLLVRARTPHGLAGQPPTPPAALQAGRRPAPAEVPAPLPAVLGPLREHHSSTSHHCMSVRT